MYQEIVVASVLDIPAQVASVAAAAGWTVNGNTFQHPSQPTYYNFTISAAEVDALNHYVYLDLSNGEQTYTRSPILGDPRTVYNPSKIHVFADITPEPFISVVIEYGYNLYRHLYMGHLEKKGDYIGGECISATWVYYDGHYYYFPYTWNSDYNQFLFNGFNNCQRGGGVAGGVRVEHADNLNTWRKFDGPSGTNAHLNFIHNEAFGGYHDGVNDPLLYQGFSDFAASNVLVPINLFVSDAGSSYDVRFRPIGTPAGPRMVNMTNLDPGAQVEVGNQFWRVFPMWSKRVETQIPQAGSRQAYDVAAQFESSLYIGVAYPEG